jgi:hypothetical protein
MILSLLIFSLGLFKVFLEPHYEEEFRLVFLENNALLISDSDIVTYNLTSQEIIITEVAQERLVNMGDELYSFTGFIININSEEVFQGVFRSAVMSAIPSPPKICILFPSMLLQSGNENPNAIRIFYPQFELPNDHQEVNIKFTEYFEKANKLIY